MDKKVFDIAIDMDDFSEQGIFAVSLVKSPAIQEDFVYLSENGRKTHRYVFNEYRKEVVGAVLIPDKLIYRFNEDIGEYYIKFSKETIEDLQYKMSKDNNYNAFTIEHALGNDNIHVLEFWIKEDAENDKSNVYGFSDLPVGTMFMKCKIDDEQVWQKIEDGELNGFSVELSSYIVPTNLSNMKKETNQVNEVVLSEETINSMVEKLKEAITPEKQEPSKIETVEQFSQSSYWTVSSSGHVSVEMGGAYLSFEVDSSFIDGMKSSVEAELKKMLGNVELSEQTPEEPVVENTVAAEAQEDEGQSEGAVPEQAVAEPTTELSEQAQQTSEESLSEEAKFEAQEAETELSEVDAETVLLSEQNEQELSEEKQPKVVGRRDPEFWEKLRSMKRSY